MDRTHGSGQIACRRTSRRNPAVQRKSAGKCAGSGRPGIKAAGRHQERIYWSGSARLSDGEVMEAHSYKEAVRADFHMDFYFSEDQTSKVYSGECVFFWVTEGGKVEIDWYGLPKDGIISKIKKQIRVIRVKRPAGKGGRMERAGGFLFPRGGNQVTDGHGGSRWKRGQW